MPIKKFRFSEPRSDLSCHHTQLPTQPLNLYYKVWLLLPQLSWHYAHMIFLIRRVVGQDRPNRSSNFIGQRNGYYVRWPSLLHLREPRSWFFHAKKHTARAVD